MPVFIVACHYAARVTPSPVICTIAILHEREDSTVAAEAPLPFALTLLHTLSSERVDMMDIDLDRPTLYKLEKLGCITIYLFRSNNIVH